MTASTFAPIDHPSAWRAADVADSPAWRVRLAPEAAAELAGGAARTDRASLASITASPVDRAAFPAAAAQLAAIEREVMLGRGFVLLNGLDPGLDDGMLKACYWIIANLLGTPLSQNSYGDLLCDVIDTGKKIGEKRVRGYQTNADLKFHTDRADIVGLLCVRKAMRGGSSSISSAVTAYNELLRRRPELLVPLTEGLYYMNVEEGGDSSLKRVPIFDLRDGVLSCRYSRNTMATAMLNGAPFTELEKEALDALDALAADPALRLDMTLERGDIQLINNYTTLHARTAFEDYPDPRLKRCKTRAWMRSLSGRPVGPHFDDYAGVPVTLEREIARRAAV
ncbi:TauD/TfdA family dioxygenase [Pigmentiphaga soli]|uniref:TauD/TfdA family dioxygenase n=1 Tax=Pigmentiphaga soli TaxID=1007095 RepID=A0ABP8H4S6_9BURK